MKNVAAMISVLLGLASACASSSSGPRSPDGGSADLAASGTGGFTAGGTDSGPVTGSGGAGSGGMLGGGGTGGNVITTGGGGSAATGTGGTSTTGTGGGVQAGAGGRAIGGATGQGGLGGTPAGGLPPRGQVVNALTLANNYFMAKWPDPGLPIVTNASRASNIWTRAVYYEGLMALNAVDPQTKYTDYAIAWGVSHTWGLNNNTGATPTRSADDQCAGQTYIDLYNMSPQPERLRDIKAAIDAMLAGTAVNDWTWIDAIQMAMPVFTRLGVLTGSTTYFNRMYSMYAYTKNTQGGSGLYSKVDHLWWRDQDFDPPYTTPNGQNEYWSRGNGWVYAALVRVLDLLPTTDAHRAEYIADFLAMSEALRAVQRADGYWNRSLHDPMTFGGDELTGTSLFTYGMAWGVRKGMLPDAVYRPIATKAWNAMVTGSLHPNGFLGWVQGSGKQPSDELPAGTGPLSYDKVPDFEDFGLGCFLLAGSEIAKLAPP